MRGMAVTRREEKKVRSESCLSEAKDSNSEIVVDLTNPASVVAVVVKKSCESVQEFLRIVIP